MNKEDHNNKPVEKTAPKPQREMIYKRQKEALPPEEKAEEGARKEKKEKKKWSLRRKIITFGALSLVLVLLFTVFYIVWDKLNRIHYVPRGDAVIDTSIVLGDEDNEYTDDELAGLSQVSSIPTPDGELLSDKNIINILLLGTDERTSDFSDNARADAIMLVSLNKRTNVISLVSFQRAIGVAIEGRPDDWLTHTFRYGGAALTVETIERCFLIDIDGYVRVNFQAFVHIVDELGGVDIELSALEAQGLNGEVETNAQAQNHMVPGVNHLDGYDSLQYVRLRYIDDDWHRIERQRTLLIAILDEIWDLSIYELNSLVDTLLPMVQTDFSMGEVLGLLMNVPQFASGEMQQMSLPQAGTFTPMISEEGRVLNVVDFEANIEILYDFIGVTAD